MKRPILLVFTAAVTGAYLGWASEIPLLFFAPLSGLLFLLPRRHRRLGILFLSILMITFLQAQRQQTTPFRDRWGEIATRQIFITDTGKTTEYTKNYDGLIWEDGRRYRVHFQTPASMGTLVAGEWVETAVEVKRGDRTQNDLLFSYDDYLLRNGKKALLQSRGPLRSAGLSEVWTYQLKRAYTDYIQDSTRALFPPETADLLQGVLSGRPQFTPEEMQIYRDLGIAHLFAVSGLHIGILFSMAFFLLTPWAGRTYARWFALFLIFLYTWIIGFPLSAMRALIMATVLVLARSLRAPYDPVTALFFAASLLLVLFPGSVVDAGFHLSILGVGSVVWLRPVLLRRWGKQTGLILSAAAIQIGTLPILLLHFQQGPLIGALSNVVLLPLFSMLIVLGVALLGLYAVLPGIALLLAPVPQTVADVFFLVTEALAGLSFPMPTLLWIGPITVAWMYFLLYLYLRPNVWFSLPVSFRTGLLQAVIFSLGASAFFGWVQPASALFLDMGQGDATLLQDSGYALLVDTGGEMQENLPDSLTGILLPSLTREGVYRLYGVFLTHFDADHSENLEGLLEAMPIDGVYVPGGLIDTPEAQVWKERLFHRNIAMIALRTGDRIPLSANSALDVLHDGSFCDNNDSLVLRYTIGNTSILFPGDLEAGGEGRLQGDLSASILKVGHHGSAGSTTDEFLKRVSPAAAIISSGYRNVYGHPHPEVLDRLARRNIETFRTDLDGNHRIQFHPGGPLIQSYPTRRPGRMEALSMIGFIPIGRWTRQISRRHYAASSISEIIT